MKHLTLLHSSINKSCPVHFQLSSLTLGFTRISPPFLESIFSASSKTLKKLDLLTTSSFFHNNLLSALPLIKDSLCCLRLSSGSLEILPRLGDFQRLDYVILREGIYLELACQFMERIPRFQKHVQIKTLVLEREISQGDLTSSDPAVPLLHKLISLPVMATLQKLGLHSSWRETSRQGNAEVTPLVEFEKRGGKVFWLTESA